MIYKELKLKLKRQPKEWLITGVAGFIGSNLLEELLNLDQKVVGLDNFSTGYQHNLNEVEQIVSNKRWKRFSFIKGDVCDYSVCQKVVKGIDYVLHQAALGSVPRSIENPIDTNSSNVTGFLNMLEVSKNSKVKSFTYATSSSAYGDHPDLPKLEENIGKPLSPYAVTKLVNEIYAEVYAQTYGFKTIGLRYFNVFGPRQDPNGPYAAVIPKWIDALIKNEKIKIYGDGVTSRDFSYVANAVQMNLLAATAKERHKNNVFNVAVGERTSLNELLDILKSSLVHHGIKDTMQPIYQNFRAGDVRHSQADIHKARNLLGYKPSHNISQGIEQSIEWYLQFLKR